MDMRKRLAKAIWKSGVTSPDLLAEYLIREGWRDTEKRPRIQQVTVIPATAIPQAMQTPMTQLPDMRSMPIDYQKTRYVQ